MITHQRKTTINTRSKHTTNFEMLLTAYNGIQMSTSFVHTNTETHKQRLTYICFEFKF